MELRKFETKCTNSYIPSYFAQSAEAVEYTDSTSAEG